MIYFDRDSGYQDVPTIIHLNTHTPIAAKEHNCTVCGLLIKIGEKYKKQVYKNEEGKIETYKMHNYMCLNEE